MQYAAHVAAVPNTVMMAIAIIVSIFIVPFICYISHFNGLDFHPDINNKGPTKI